MNLRSILSSSLAIFVVFLSIYLIGNMEIESEAATTSPPSPLGALIAIIGLIMVVIITRKND